MAVWGNGSTGFATAALVILLLGTIALVFFCVIRPVKPAKFGTNVPPAPEVPVAMNPQTGQMIVQSQNVAWARQSWADNMGWLWLAVCIQFLIAVFFLSAMAADSWTTTTYRTTTTNSATSFTQNFGVVRQHSSEMTQSYADFCSSLEDVTNDKSDLNACRTLRATGAFILILGLICMVTIAILTVKGFLLGACAYSAHWHEWQGQAGVLQCILLGAIMWIWALAGHVDLKQTNGSLSWALGPSWGLTITCFILSWWPCFYWRASVQCRPNGQPRALQAQAPTVVVLQQQPMIIQGGAQPVAYAQPAVYIAGAQPQQVMMMQQQPQQHQIQMQPMGVQVGQPVHHMGYNAQQQQLSPQAYPQQQYSAVPQQQQNPYAPQPQPYQPQPYNQAPPAYSGSAEGATNPYDQQQYQPQQHQQQQQQPPLQPFVFANVDKPGKQ